ncbi:MAG: hypothetical protein N2312_02970 [Dictyoglomaceae bacterium]|nr:hypothetical protein [Dictyoglomaceae bacterium]
MRKVTYFIFCIVLILVAGCVKPLTIMPQFINIEGIEVRLSLMDSYEWSALSKDILVINLEITNLRKESIWVYPINKSVIIDSLNRQYSPLREISYQKAEPSPRFSLEFLFSTQKPPEFSFFIEFGDEKKEKEFLKLIEKFNLMKFKDGRIFPGATVSGILIFYASQLRLPGRFIIPDIYLEESMRNINFEFIIGR